MNIRIMLFKNWKLLIEMMHQTPLLISQIIEAIDVEAPKSSKMKIEEIIYFFLEQI